jgi:hypothetical protein
MKFPLEALLLKAFLASQVVHASNLSTWEAEAGGSSF